jgi:hypothetical protein
MRPAHRTFREWFNGLRRRNHTQGTVAKALDVAQQTISAVLGGAIPGPDLARLIEEAGGPAADAWRTEHERQSWAARVERARSLRA